MKPSVFLGSRLTIGSLGEIGVEAPGFVDSLAHLDPVSHKPNHLHHIACDTKGRKCLDARHGYGMGQAVDSGCTGVMRG